MLLNTEADIFDRIIRPDNSEGSLDPDERRELDGYLLVGHLLAIAHSKARQSLQRHHPAA